MTCLAAFGTLCHIIDTECQPSKQDVVRLTQVNCFNLQVIEFTKQEVVKTLDVLRCVSALK